MIYTGSALPPILYITDQTDSHLAVAQTGGDLCQCPTAYSDGRSRRVVGEDARLSTPSPNVLRYQAQSECYSKRLREHGRQVVVVNWGENLSFGPVMSPYIYPWSRLILVYFVNMVRGTTSPSLVPCVELTGVWNMSLGSSYRKTRLPNQTINCTWTT